LGAGGVGIDYCCAAWDYVAHGVVWQDVEEHECSVDEFKREEKDDGQDGDDVAVREEEVGEALEKGAEEEPC
jgi:hypothetical protein